MAQHDYVIDNASGAAVRADLNLALAAIVSLNSGGTEPTTTYAYMLWVDTANSLIKMRNAANNSWITVGTLGATNLGLIPTPGAGTADYVLSTNGAAVYSWVARQQISRATVQATTSGTTIDFTGAPSWAKKVTVMLAGVSTSGTSPIIIQLGTAAGFTTTGYLCGANSNGGQLSNTSGFLASITRVAGDTTSGTMTIANITSNQWVASCNVGNTATAGAITSGGDVSLATILTQVRLTTVNGTDTFDAGSVNVLYEG